MDLFIKINLDNDVFNEPEGGGLEVVRILEEIAGQFSGLHIVEAPRVGLVHDINGNKIGYWNVK